jgi:hypothetical protein
VPTTGGVSRSCTLRKATASCLTGLLSKSRPWLRYVTDCLFTRRNFTAYRWRLCDNPTSLPLCPKGASDSPWRRGIPTKKTTVSDARRPFVPIDDDQGRGVRERGDLSCAFFTSPINASITSIVVPP